MISTSILKKILFLSTVLLLISVFYFPFGTRQVATKNVRVIQTTPDTPATLIASQQSDTQPSPTNSAGPMSIPVAKAAALPVGKPVRLIIPSIHVNANIEYIGLTATGAVGVPAGARDVSWFDLGPRPGQQGSAVISGHYGRWKNGTDSVFNLLPELKPGDIIYVKDDKGTTRSFTVKKTRVYGKDETVPEIFNKSDNAYLNIITCHGTYLESQQTYSQRLVIFSQLNPS